MGFFNKILSKLGLAKPEAEAPAAAPSKPVTAAAAPAKPVAAAAVKPAVVPAAPKPVVKPAAEFGREEDVEDLRNAAAEPKVAAISEVDVVAKLETMAAGSDFNWKVSIVDLLKVLGLDSDKDARIELAKELGCPAELIGGDYAKMNVWLHKEVLKQIAQNGGNIPKELLD